MGSRRFGRRIALAWGSRRPYTPGVRRFVAFALSTSFLATALLSSRDAAAFCRTTTESGTSQACAQTGKPVFWRNACVGYRVNEAASTKVTLAETNTVAGNAFGSWSALSCGPAAPSIAAVNIGTTKSTAIGYDQASGATNENIIVYRDGDWPYADQSQVALTTLTYRKDTGELLDADMEVNATLKLVAADPIPSNGFDLLTVFTHEAGHFLGLAHTDVPKATMFASYDPGTVDQRTQKQDDVDGICAAYPSSGNRPTAAGNVAAGKCDPRKTPTIDSGSSSSSGCSAGGNGVAGSGGWGLGLVGLAGAMAMRRARKTRAA